MFSKNQLIGALLIGVGAGLILSVIFGGWFLRILIGAAVAVIGWLLGRCG